MSARPRLATLALVALAGTGVAQAHAQLERAEPRVGSVVSVAPGTVTLSFSEAIEPAFSAVEVVDASGRRVDSGKIRVEPGQPRRAQVSVKTLPAGQYTVRWRVLSVDTHRSEGSFTFDVRP